MFCKVIKTNKNELVTTRARAGLILGGRKMEGAVVDRAKSTYKRDFQGGFFPLRIWNSMRFMRHDHWIGEDESIGLFLMARIAMVLLCLCFVLVLCMCGTKQSREETRKLLRDNMLDMCFLHFGWIPLNTVLTCFLSTVIGACVLFSQL
ncbi:hypothetical protein B0O80DRAFT_198983 [Mortierella sp. GBAus27b]|nr:hypothetical protein B0O80DRAFT_198983 [Mortierella sp. GBAus27b]